MGHGQTDSPSIHYHHSQYASLTTPLKYTISLLGIWTNSSLYRSFP